ncbi:GNAT family N-acetyltransferase [Pseudomonas sp. MAFF212428]|uniref:GNAT family N-acetyltransferase n=1 Tax=Pseudomonas brassicae TaxID=2708063 RepID=A0A6B3NYZ5_9PSED|nr:GNAT family N-acetyltransferase [Pseudomonas brassicae]NER61424.1 GNAT family N-acetyltransferase [Pseudomonas brassicae]NER65390.1 GNAT family N-acetyltransferase [Pseudomonas brassicae]
MHPDPVEVRTVERSDIPQAIDFVMQARAELFPKLAGASLPADLAQFEQVYLHGAGRFVLACDAGQIVAAVGYLPYDHRFSQLDYRRHNTVEVVRLFVRPAYRRGGLAGRLYQALRALAEADGVQVLYLHTHPFLPGAIGFWQKHGFQIIDVEDDPVWQTTHMQCRLPLA